MREPLAYVQFADSNIYIKYSHYISAPLAYPLIHILAELHKIDLGPAPPISNNALRCPYELAGVNLSLDSACP
jgi:hypothetical protein